MIVVLLLLGLLLFWKCDGTGYLLLRCLIAENGSEQIDERLLKGVNSLLLLLLVAPKQRSLTCYISKLGIVERDSIREAAAAKAAVPVIVLLRRQRGRL